MPDMSLRLFRILAGSKDFGRIGLGLRLKKSVLGGINRMTVREVLELIEDDGWRFVRQKGSHRQYKHPTKRGKVTVAGHPYDDLHPKTLRTILQQAGLEE
jgi:predicted RNA binding protein YcfA (HicA-like mRNA interferase family)